MCAPMEAHPDFVVGHGDIGRHVDQVTEYLARLRIVARPRQSTYERRSIDMSVTAARLKPDRMPERCS